MDSEPGASRRESRSDYKRRRCQEKGEKGAGGVKTWKATSQCHEQVVRARATRHRLGTRRVTLEKKGRKGGETYKKKNHRVTSKTRGWRCGRIASVGTPGGEPE